MTTREEFEGLVVTLLNCESDAEWHKRCGTYDDATIDAMERRDEAWAALFAAHDAQAARIAELEADRDHWRNLVDDLQNNGIYLDSIAFYEGRHAESTARIAELEAALHMLVDWPDNDCEPGVYGEGYCVYGCQMTEGMDEEMHHAPYCPISLARTVLSKEA